MDIDLSLSHATVFLDRALVKRKGKIHLPQGTHKIHVRNLPVGMIDESALFAGRGISSKLLGLSISRQFFAEIPNTTVQDLQNQIEDLQHKDLGVIAACEAKDSEIKSFESLLTQSKIFAKAIFSKDRSVQEFQGTMDSLAQNVERIKREIIDLQKERRIIAKQIQQLQQQISILRSSTVKERKVAVAEIETKQEGDLEIELRYMIYGASWIPLYDFRVADDKVQVTYRAQVSQNTGEDWLGVELSLSTTRPSFSHTIPDVPIQELRQRPVVRMRVSREYEESAPPQPAPMAGGGPVAALASVLREEMPAEMIFDEATLQETGASVTFELTGLNDINGNGEGKKVHIADFPLETHMDRITAPILEEVVYRRAKIKNTYGAPLLAGSVELFDQDQYLGKTNIDFIAPQETFDLALGIDDSIKVKRKLEAKDSEKSFVGDKKRIHYSFTINLENLASSSKKIIVKDRIPHSNDEGIKVKMDETIPKVSTQTSMNLLEWECELDSLAKKDIQFTYTVEFPRSMDVIGLD